jgi:hypothetical protein
LRSVPGPPFKLTQPSSSPSRCRTENCIKNFWNATGRSKTAARNKTLLWVYISQVG